MVDSWIMPIFAVDDWLFAWRRDAVVGNVKEKMQRVRKMNIKSVFFCLCLCCLLCSCATKQGAVRQLESFSKELRDHSVDYSINDWEKAADKFGKIRQRISKHEYTPSERREIGKLEGQCVRYVVKGAKEGLTNGLFGIGSELRGILDELSGFADAEDL